jgi:hypothetical protein
MKQLNVGLLLALVPACAFAQAQAQDQGQTAPIQILQPASRPKAGLAYQNDAARAAGERNPRAEFVTLKKDQAAHKLPELPASAASAAADHSAAITLPSNWQN